MKISSILLATLGVASLLPAQDITPVRPEALENWRDARFGMFIHWGPVSLTGHEIGWSRGKETPTDEYDNLYKRKSPNSSKLPLSTLWFDVPQAYDQTYGIPMVKMLRKLQPDLMINNRAYSVGGKGSGIGHQLPIGDYDTPEQSIGGFNMDRPWETCMTICQQWAWKPNDNMKSLKDCIHTLIRTNGGDGNLLFNVGPMPIGEIEPRQVERLKEMGAWLRKNGESIYGTRGGPWKPASHLVSTRKNDKIYLHLLKKTESPFRLSAAPVAIRSAKLLNGPAIKTATREGILFLDVPDNAWDQIDTIIELTVAGSAMDIEPLNPARGFSIPGTKTTFKPVTTRAIRLNILDASDGPTISEIRLPGAKQKP